MSAGCNRSEQGDERDARGILKLPMEFEEIASPAEMF
jgi:hypothetical protein